MREAQKRRVHRALTRVYKGIVKEPAKYASEPRCDHGNLSLLAMSFVIGRANDLFLTQK